MFAEMAFGKETKAYQFLITNLCAYFLCCPGGFKLNKMQGGNKKVRGSSEAVQGENEIFIMDLSIFNVRSSSIIGISMLKS